MDFNHSMKKVSPTMQNKQYFLKIYLQSRRYTLKDLKCEVILMMCEMLIDEFIKAENSNKNEILIEDFSISNKKYIYSNLKQLQIDLKENILTVNKMQLIINSQNLSKENFIKAKITESLFFFYNTCVTTLKNSILKRNKEEKIKWIPDLLCISLIQDMIEKNYNFQYFTFLEKYDFNNILNIYYETNSLLKKRENITLMSKEQTIITQMFNVSIDIVEKLISTKYK